MRILYVITGLGMGGAENQLISLSEKMVERGHTVKIVSLTGETLVSSGLVKLDIAELGMKKTFFSFISSLIKVKKIIKQYKPDVVHSHMVHANLFCRTLRLVQHCNRLICTAHNTSEGGKIRAVLYRTTNFLCDYFSNVSQEAVEAFEEQNIVRPGKMHCVYNGIDTNKFSFNVDDRKRIRKEFKYNDEDRVFIAVGRFNTQKDYPNLLDAFRKVYFDNKNAKLLIVGDGPLRDKIELLIKEYQLSSAVTLCGIRNDIAPLMSGADFFVLSSAWEGFGLVVAEAMSCMRPVVATDCGGVSEVVGGNGILVPPRNSSELATGMCRLLQFDSIELDKVAVSSRKYIESTYSLDKIVCKWIDVYLGGKYA